MNEEILGHLIPFTFTVLIVLLVIITFKVTKDYLKEQNETAEVQER